MHPRFALLIFAFLFVSGCAAAPAAPQAAAPAPTPTQTCPASPVVPSTPSSTAPAASAPAATEPAPVDAAFVIPAPLPIYTDQLAEGWQDWSWDTEHDLAATSPTHTGSSAISVTYQKGWAGLYFHLDPPLVVGDYSEICFYLHGGQPGGQRINLVVNMDNAKPFGVTAPAGDWQLITVPLASVGSPAAISDLVFQEATGGGQPTFYLDQIELVSSGPAPTATPLQGGLILQVDAAANQRPIDPHIYGLNFADETLLKELRLPVNRWGGNATTRYNWQIDVSNRAGDWFYENIPDDPGAAARFVTSNQSQGADTILTVPMIGWTPKSREITCGFSIAKYGPQQAADPYQPDCGNGVRPDGSLIRNNDPADTSQPIDPGFVQDWVQSLVQQFGPAGQGGVKFYNLDNEPYLWSTNHRDVHPNPVSYDELRDRTYQYAAAVKQADPSAQTLGPVEWGWSGYFFSAKDAAGDGKWWTQPLDRLKHGNQPLVEWYLQQMQAYEREHGLRILDYLDLHYYPQAQGVPLSSQVDPDTQALRLRSTRSLWDPSYTDESWIGEPVYLIPRMRAWVDQFYPGTKIALTEYNWGALDHINGALAQAEVLGIFGREGLDLATLWDPPAPDQPGAFAFRMYRSYDGQGGQFGDTSVQAASNHSEVVSIFAARRAADGALTVMLINTGSAAQPARLSLANFSPTGPAQVYQYSSTGLDHIQRLDDLPIPGGSFDLALPASSIILIVLPG